MRASWVRCDSGVTRCTSRCATTLTPWRAGTPPPPSGWSGGGLGGRSTPAHGQSTPLRTGGDFGGGSNNGTLYLTRGGSTYDWWQVSSVQVVRDGGGGTLLSPGTPSRPVGRGQPGLLHRCQQRKNEDGYHDFDGGLEAPGRNFDGYRATASGPWRGDSGSWYEYFLALLDPERSSFSSKTISTRLGDGRRDGKRPLACTPRAASPMRTATSGTKREARPRRLARSRYGTGSVAWPLINGVCPSPGDRRRPALEGTCPGVGLWLGCILVSPYPGGRCSRTMEGTLPAGSARKRAAEAPHREQPPLSEYRSTVDGPSRTSHVIWRRGGPDGRAMTTRERVHPLTERSWSGAGRDAGRDSMGQRRLRQRDAEPHTHDLPMISNKRPVVKLPIGPFPVCSVPGCKIGPEGQ